MGLSYNISFSIAAFIIVAILVLIVSVEFSSSHLISKRFRYFLISSLVMFAFDVGTVVSNDYASSVPVWLNYVLNSLYFISNSIVAILFLYYVLSLALKDSAKEMRKKLYIVNLSALALLIVAMVFNGFFGFFFNFNSGAYAHGDAYLALHGLTIAYLIEAMVFFILRRHVFNRRELVSIVTFYVIFFTSFALQLFAFPNILLSDFGASLGALIMFFSLETPDYVKLMATLNELNELKSSLEIQVRSRTDELDKEKHSYEELTLETLSSLARVIDAKDHYTVGHSFRVAAYSRGIALEMGLSSERCEKIYLAGLIHDVGKIGINEAILNKPGKLNENEFRIIQAHSSLGGDILKGIHQFPVFEQVARSHHERYDGAGYPDKLRAEEIPMEARIVSVADTFDAMTSDRIYRKAFTDEYAIEELRRVSGTQLDPVCVEAFLSLIERFPDSIRNHIDDLVAIKE